MPKVLEKLVTLSWYAVVLLVCWIVLVSFLPYSPLRGAVPAVQEEKLTAFIPQGWGFFTKDPQERRLHFYAIDDGGNWRIDDMANASLRNKFGASRLARLRGIELGELLAMNNASDADWTKCQSTSIEDCLHEAQAIVPVQMSNKYPTHLICGDKLLLQQAPNPWAYHQAGFDNGHEISYLRTEVRCS